MSLRALLYRRPSEPSAIQVVFDRAIYLVRLRRHRQARRYTLRIDASAREVIAHNASARKRNEAKEFAQKHGGWIAARLKRLPEAAHSPMERKCRCAAYRIDRSPARRTRDSVDGNSSSGDCLLASPARPRISIAASMTSSSARQRATCEGEPALRREVGVAFKRISVRDQSSRWGSCSNTGVLSFSWRLILAPPFVLEYLAAHEVCHLVELNHSPRFWRLVKRVYPISSAPKTWLDVHGADLHRYGFPRPADERHSECALVAS